MPTWPNMHASPNPVDRSQSLMTAMGARCVNAHQPTARHEGALWEVSIPAVAPLLGNDRSFPGQHTPPLLQMKIHVHTATVSTTPLA
mmetsp:Transcript_19221/g.57152  ORF Transcript_19221/g.57152 Transcript_19221/m.57152 type:complete len:87 (+) Transcript_19221:764-1024(+)